MKSIKCLATLLALLTCGSAIASAQSNLAKDPAYLPIDEVMDLKVAKPEVNVNLPRFLLMDVVSDLELNTNNPFAAAGVPLKELVQEIQLIRFLVISANDDNRDYVDQGVAALQKRLETNWTCIFSVPEEQVGVYALSDATGEAVGGVAVLIHNDGETVIGNVVGRVSIGKLIKLASNMGNGKFKLPKELLENIMKSAAGSAAESSPDKSEPKEQAKTPKP